MLDIHMFLRLYLGTIKSFFLEDLRSLLGRYGLNISLRYRGPRPFSTLKTRRSRLLSTVETCSYLLLAVSWLGS